MKKALVSAILVAIFAMSIALPANAFYYPGAPPTDDGKYANFGPITTNLILKPYASQEGEYLAFKACDVDFMDWSLLSTQVDELNTEDPTMTTYARAFFVDRGMREFDFNCLRFPTDDVAMRRALSKMFDKDAFVATQLAGYAARMDSPLTNHGAYYNPYCTNLYPYDLSGAQADLTAAGYVDSDADGWREGPAGQEIVLDIYIRSDDPDRDVMGTIFCTNVRACGLQTNEQHQPRSVCRSHCMMSPYDYNVYTGGWSFGRDPDVLYSLFLSDYAQAFDGTPNYPGYTSATFDAAALGMLTAPTIGDSVTPSTAIYHTWEMQRILMDDAGVMPVFTYASYGAYKTGWEKVVNGIGVGPWSWYTFMSTNKPGTDTVVWGQMNDITDWNPYHSQWVWDWNLLALIYDGMINVNPYNPAQDLPWLAQEWTVGTWNMPAVGECSTIEFKLREDVYWQDIAPNPTRSTPNGAPLLRAGATNVKFTADDVVFSINSVKNIPDSWNNALVADVVYAEKLDPYRVKVYMDLMMPLWALHWIGGLPIVPKHVWQPVYNEGTTKTFDAIGQQCLVGTGPWQYDYAASVLHSQYVLHAYQRFFRYHPLDLWASMANRKVVLPCTTIGPIDVWVHWMDPQRPTVPAGTYTVHWELTGPGGITGSGDFAIGVPILYCVPLHVGTIPAVHVGRGLYTWTFTIGADTGTGHTDVDGWSEYVWATIPEDINLDFYVNAKDAVALGAAFGSSTTSTNWDPACDINKDGYVNAKDAVKLGAVFGWAG